MDGIITGNTSHPFQQTGQFDHLDPLQQQIMSFVHNTPSTNEGVHVQTIAQSIHAPSAKVLQAVEQLTTEGLLYTTIDDDHVLSSFMRANNSPGEEHDCRVMKFHAEKWNNYVGLSFFVYYKYISYYNMGIKGMAISLYFC